MDSDALRDLCLSLRGSDETFPFGAGTSVFKVADKIFAISRLGEPPLSVSLKCEPALAEQLRDVHPAVAAGYHLNKRHWNTVTIDGSLPDTLIAEMVEDSYDWWSAGCRGCVVMHWAGAATKTVRPAPLSRRSARAAAAARRHRRPAGNAPGHRRDRGR